MGIVAMVATISPPPPLPSLLRESSHAPLDTTIALLPFFNGWEFLCCSFCHMLVVLGRCLNIEPKNATGWAWPSLFDTQV